MGLSKRRMRGGQPPNDDIESLGGDGLEEHCDSTVASSGRRISSEGGRTDSASRAPLLEVPPRGMFGSNVA
jgi:hypothetical protein